MNATVTLRSGRINNAARFGVVLNEPFEVRVNSVSGPVKWSATADDVLHIKEQGGPVAMCKATAPGTSILTIWTRHQKLRLTIDVYVEPAVKVGFSFGNVRDRVE